MLCQAVTTVTIVPSAELLAVTPGGFLSAGEVGVVGGVMRIVILLQGPFSYGAEKAGIAAKRTSWGP